MAGWRRWIWLGVLGVLLAAGIGYSLRPQPALVDLGVVALRPLAVTVGDEGRTRVKEIYVVSAPVAGRLGRIDAEVGDPVVAGDTVLAEITPSQPAFLDVRSRTEAEAIVKAAEAALTLARTEVARAEAELDYALKELARTRQLAARQTASERALDIARREAATRRAALDAAKAARDVKAFELENAKARLIDPGFGQLGQARFDCCVDVRAPVGGRVLRLIQESETVVAAGAPLVEIGDPGDLEVVVDLLSRDAVKVRVGAPAVIRDWGGEADLAAIVRRVEPYGFTEISALGVEEQRVNVVLDFSGDAAARRPLGDGYRVDVRIVVWQAEQALTVPTGALFRAGEDWAVFVPAAGVARLRRVAIGHMNDELAEVLDGLEPGTSVVLHPSDKLADGVPVEAREVAPVGG